MSDREYVDVVNEEDVIVGTRTLHECLNRGLLHRMVSIFVRNSKGEIFLQQRSKSDDWLPGRWTASCTGHVKSGEEPALAAKRELREELGLSCEPVFLFKFIVPPVISRGKTEWEIDFVYRALSDERMTLDSREIEQGRFFQVEECREFFQRNKNEITPDAIMSFARFMQIEQQS